MAEIIAETARLVLRREAAGDRAIWFEAINSPATMAHVGGVKPRERVEADFDRMAQDSEFPWLLVALREDNTLLGKCGIARIEGATVPAALTGEVQIGWTIRADHWRRGCGLEAARAMLDLAFGRYGLERVFAQTSERNVGSWRLIERLGMQRRAELDYDDPDYPAEENPTLIWVLERAAWQAACRLDAKHA